VTAPSPGYRRLALWTAAATFLLIVLGGVVRVSESGLGCGPGGSGVHGWPLCKGDVIPGFSLHTGIEYAHRALASIVGVEMFLLAFLAWRRHRHHRRLVRATIGGAPLIVAQVLLGAVTVEKGLDEPLVAAHLGLAMLLLAVTLYVARAARPEAAGADPAEATPGFRRHALATQVLLFATIVAGGYMAGTEHLGRSDQHLTDGAHHACGNRFPACNDGFLPFGNNRFVDIHLTHRVLVYLFSAAVIALIAMALRRRIGAGVTRAARALAALLVVQIALGGLNVWLTGEYELLILAHLAVATLMWGALTVLTLQLYRIPAPAEERAGRLGRADERAVTV
jgi:heme A synthase